MDFVSEEATNGGFNHGQFILEQEVPRAEAGLEVELTMNLLFIHLDPDGNQVFEIARGHIGMTEVEILNYIGDEPVLIETIRWDGIAEGERNAMQFEIPTSLFMEPPS
jgi:hypothetical protein